MYQTTFLTHKVVGAFQFSRQEEISGDVSRTINTSDPLKADEYIREIYLREVDRLAETLYVPNYRRPEVRRYAFERAGSEFIMAVLVLLILQ